MKKNDIVNHPSHYTDGQIEVIDFIEDKQLGFCLGNAVKYISRAGKKDPNKEIEDLEKAIWYIKRRIKELKGDKQNIVDEPKKVEFDSDNNSSLPISKGARGLRKETPIYEEIISTCEEPVEENTLDESKQVDVNGLTEDNANKLTLDTKDLEDNIWDGVYQTLHNIDPNYTREQFEKDLKEAKEVAKKEIPTLTDFSKIFN